MRSADTASLKTVRAILEDLQTAPNRTLGQNFLVNAAVLDRIVATAALSAEDAVLEIGPGLGALTSRLAAQSAHTAAIEKDERLAQWLQCQSWVHDSGAAIIPGDALKISWEQTGLPQQDVKLVANLPYSVSKPLLRRILENWRLHLHSATIMVQKEVALRLTATAGDGDWGPMGIMAGLYSDARRCFDIAPGCFWPPPAITSTVVHLALHPEPRVELANEAFFWKIVRAAFNMRRKQLLNSLQPLAGDKATLIEILNDCEINPERRPQTVTIEEFARLAARFQENLPNHPNDNNQESAVL